MTDLNTLHAEGRALVTFGAERYEDRVVCGGVYRFLGDVGGIPAAAWGTLPLSAQLRRDWATALGNRMGEAKAARDEMERMADGLMQIAANYEGVDLRVKTTFDLVNRDLAPFVAVSDGYTDEVSVRPFGAGVVSDPFATRLPDDQPVVQIPPDNDRLAALRHEQYPTTRVTEEPITLGTDGEDLWFGGGRTVAFVNGQENDQLNEFVQKYRSMLLQLEAVLTELGVGQRMPLSDLIIHAWRTCPKIIRNRADLVHSAANTYAELRASMDADLKGLKLYWQGSAASAFAQYADLTSAYLTQIEAQARWLAEEGKKAASTLEGLRNAYASVGYDRIGSLIKAFQEYSHAISKPLGGACSNPEGDLVDAVSHFVDYLETAEQRHMELLSVLIKVEEQERKERPDIGNRGHDLVPFPKPAVGAGAWADQRGWQPQPSRPLE